MNKGILNKVLIVAVGTVWILVGYRLVKRFFGEAEMAQLQAPPEMIMPDTLLKRDTFQLKTIDRDPFLGTYAKPVREKRLPILGTDVPITRNSKTIPWPRIEYYGFVKSENSASPLLLFKIDNQLHRLRKKEKVNGIFVKEIYGDSVLVMNGAEKRVFKKQS